MLYLSLKVGTAGLSELRTKRATSSNEKHKPNEYLAVANATLGQQYARMLLILTTSPAQQPGVKAEGAWVAVRNAGPWLKERSRADRERNRRDVRQEQKVREPRLGRPIRGHQNKGGLILPGLPEHLGQNREGRKRVRQEG